MQVGLSLPQFGPTATREHVLRCAQAADAAGFDSLWAADHVVVPREFRSPYPYAADGINSTIYPPDVMLEALTLLTFVAGATRAHPARYIGASCCRCGSRCYSRRCSQHSTT